MVQRSGTSFFFNPLTKADRMHFPTLQRRLQTRDPKAAMGTKGLHLLRRLTLVFFQYSWYCFLGCDDQDLDSGLHNSREASARLLHSSDYDNIDALINADVFESSSLCRVC